jgi:hypothetical protein
VGELSQLLCAIRTSVFLLLGPATFLSVSNSLAGVSAQVAFLANSGEASGNEKLTTAGTLEQGAHFFQPAYFFIESNNNFFSCHFLFPY